MERKIDGFGNRMESSTRDGISLLYLAQFCVIILIVRYFTCQVERIYIMPF